MTVLPPEPNPSPTQPPDAYWDVIIRAQRGWWDLHLRDVWQYRDLIFLFVRRDFVSQFKQTILGPVWFVLQPLLTTLLLVLVFGHIARLSTDGLPQILFYLSGCILWQTFAMCLTQTSATFSANAHLFGKVYFPRLAVPLSVTISQLIKMALQLLFFALLAVCLALNGAALRVTWAAWLLPLLITLMAALGLGMGLFVSCLTRKYRDLTFLLQFGVPLAMYTTTVAYPLSAIPDGAARILMLANPMTPIIETFRYATLGAGSFCWLHLAYSATFATVVLLVGVLMFSKAERTFMDTV